MYLELFLTKYYSIVLRYTFSRVQLKVYVKECSLSQGATSPPKGSAVSLERFCTFTIVSTYIFSTAGFSGRFSSCTFYTVYVESCVRSSLRRMCVRRKIPQPVFPVGSRRVRSTICTYTVLYVLV